MEVSAQMPLIGDKLPSMTVQTTYGIKKIPEDYAGKWLILFSHPGDFTPVCTTEFVSFARNNDTFSQLNAELLGLSIDQVQPHMKWVEWIEETLGQSIPFPIIADALGKVAATLGMIHAAKKTATVRAVYFIDPTRTIRLSLYYAFAVVTTLSALILSFAALPVAHANK